MITAISSARYSSHRGQSAKGTQPTAQNSSLLLRSRTISPNDLLKNRSARGFATTFGTNPPIQQLLWYWPLSSFVFSTLDPKKVYELRTYSIDTDCFPAFLELTNKHIQKRLNYSKLIAYWVSTSTDWLSLLPLSEIVFWLSLLLLLLLLSNLRL